MDIDTMEAGRSMDVAVAQKVMELTVPRLDWPCGYQPDGCNREAAMPSTDDEYKFIQPITPDPMYVDSSFYNERHPIYEVRRDDGSLAYYQPVKHYSEDFAAAMDVVEKLLPDSEYEGLSMEYQDGQWTVGITSSDYYEGVTFDNPAYADTLPLAICRAAYKAARR